MMGWSLMMKAEGEYGNPIAKTLFSVYELSN